MCLLLIMKGIFCCRKYLLLRECWYVMVFFMSDINLVDVKISIDYFWIILWIIFGVIVFLVFLGNGLVCVVIFWSCIMLKNLYNLMIFVLVFIDMFIGKVYVIKVKFNVWSRNLVEYK